MSTGQRSIIAGIALLLLPVHAIAFGEINPLEWQLQGIGDTLRKLDGHLRELKSLEQEKNSRLIEIKKREAWDRTFSRPTSRPSLDLDPDRCPAHSRPLSEQEAYGSGLLAQIDEMQRILEALQFPTQSSKLGLAPDLVSEIQSMKYAERSAFWSLVFSKRQELYAAQDELTETANSLCRCDVGWISDNAQGLCVREISESAPPSSRMDIQDTRINQSMRQLPSDVPSDAWYADAINEIVYRGALSQYNPSHIQPFRPTELAKKHELVEMIVFAQAKQLHNPPSSPSFDDVPFTTRFNSAFEIAAQEGWLSGNDNCLGKKSCSAQPEKSLNRAEAAALITRAFDLDNTNQSPTFEDTHAGQWFTEPIRTAASHCILRGDEDTGRVRPSDTLNRAEMVVMIARASARLTYPNCGE